MGIRLIVEVLDNTPASLSSAERLVLVVLAEYANDDTRECWPGDDLIARRAGLAVESLTNIFRRLAAHGLEVRVPHASTAAGRPLFAFHGRRKTYRIPPLTARSPVEEPGMKTGPRTGQPSEARSPDTRSPVARHPMPGPATGPNPQEPSENPQTAAAAIVITKTNANPDEAIAVVGRIVAQRASRREPIRRPAAYLATLDASKLQGHVDAARDEQRSARLANAARCPKHPGDYLADNCGPCRSERVGAA